MILAYRKNTQEKQMKNFKHYTGPHYPICQYPGTQVLNPFLGEQISQDEVIHILVCRDPRRNAPARTGFKLR